MTTPNAAFFRSRFLAVLEVMEPLANEAMRVRIDRARAAANHSSASEQVVAKDMAWVREATDMHLYTRANGVLQHRILATLLQLAGVIGRQTCASYFRNQPRERGILEGALYALREPTADRECGGIAHHLAEQWCPTCKGVA